MFKLWLPNMALRTKEIEVPNLKDPIALNMVVVKGITIPDIPKGSDFSVWKDIECSGDGMLLGHASLFEFKHMVMGDLSRYRELTRNYYHHEAASKSYAKLKKDLMSQYDGIIDGEIVTLIFFVPQPDLFESVNGSRTETTDSQSTEQA